MPSKQFNLSAVIIAKDEEKLIGGCLKSVGFCDEIIVIVDAKSLDATEQISKRHTKNVFKRQFDNFASQKNFAIDKASKDWILIIDADERVTRELEDEIKSALLTSNWGFEIPTKPFFFGLEVKHGGFAPSYHLRLFRKGGRYNGEVHEVIAPQGEVGRLNSPLVHFNYFNIHHFVDQLNFYTDFEAIKLDKLGKKFKPRFVLTGPLREFLFRFIKMSGWRDGFVGLSIAMLMSFYRLCSVLKLWEIQRSLMVEDAYKKIDKDIVR